MLLLCGNTRSTVLYSKVPCVQIVCGNRAGAATILLDELDEHKELSGEEVPSFRARSMHEVAELLKHKFDLRPRESGPT